MTTVIAADRVVSLSCISIPLVSRHYVRKTFVDFHYLGQASQAVVDLLSEVVAYLLAPLKSIVEILQLGLLSFHIFEFREQGGDL